MGLRALALAAVGLLAAAGAAAGEPVWGQTGRSQADVSLVRVDPATLRPVGRALPLGAFSGERAFSPIGSTLAIAASEGPRLRLVGLDPPRIVGTIRLAASGMVQWLGWRGDRIVALVDPEAGGLLVEIDPATRTVARTLRFRGELANTVLAGGRVVTVEWPARTVGAVRLHVLEPDGRLRSAPVERIAGGWLRRGTRVLRMAEPGLAVDPGGTRAWLADADGEICAVELDTLAIACHPLRTTATTTKGSEPWSRRQLKLVAERTLALSGWEKPKAGPRAAKAVGLWLVDTDTWQRRLVDGGIDSFRFAGGVLVGVRRNGVTAYGPDGTRRYGIDEPFQLGVISTTGPYLYIPRADGRTVVAELATGRVLRRPEARARPFQDADTW